MEKLLKKFMAKINPRETRELLQDHVKRLELSTTGNSVTLHVDKRYAFNAINSFEHIEQVVKRVKEVFGQDASTIILLDRSATGREREKAVPHAIHYR